MDGTFIPAVALGVGIMAFIFFALSSKKQTAQQRKAIAVGSGSVGVISSFWLMRHPDKLEYYSGIIANKGIAILIAAVGTALIIWKIRSIF